MKDLAKAVIVLAIGGGVYTLGQADVANKFSANTGMTQQQAEEYINNISEDELASFDEIGNDFIEDGNAIIEIATQIDCVNYAYEWEVEGFTCQEGKSQLYEVGNDEINLGKAYKKLDQEDADESDISATIPLIDKLNADYELPIVAEILDANTIEESRKTNAYNKSLLQAALEST